MPDLLAGTTVKALDTPPTVSDFEGGNFSFTATTYGVATTAGTYADCGVAFTACTTGRAFIHYSAAMVNSGANTVRIAPVVRTGSTVGSGTVHTSASDDNAILVTGTDSTRTGVAVLISGLTPGDAYNVRLEHRVGGGTGTAERRTVIVQPAT